MLSVLDLKEVNMLFKNLRRSNKPVPSGLSPTNQQQETEMEDIQRLIDDTTIANKPSRLQVFELRPTRVSRFRR
jgi:hypothetical protein